jgi:hypothetical protein
MSLTLELPPDAETWLQAQAAATGQAPEAMAARLFSELIEDLQDIEEARRSLAEPGDSIPWEQVKAEIQADRAHSDSGAQREAA